MQKLRNEQESLFFLFFGKVSYRYASVQFNKNTNVKIQM